MMRKRVKYPLYFLGFCVVVSAFSPKVKETVVKETVVTDNNNAVFENAARVLSSVKSTEVESQLPVTLQENREYVPLNIADGFTFHDKPAFSIHFGKSSTDYFDLTMTCQFFKKSPVNKTIKVNAVDMPEASFEYHFGSRYFPFSSHEKYRSWAKIDFLAKDLKGGNVSFSVNGSVLDNQAYVAVNTGQNIVTLTKENVAEIKKVCK